MKRRENKKSENLEVVKTKIGRIMLLSKCVVCDSKKLKFLKEQKARELLSSLRIRTALSKTPRLDPLLF